MPAFDRQQEDDRGDGQRPGQELLPLWSYLGMAVQWMIDAVRASPYSRAAEPTESWRDPPGWLSRFFHQSEVLFVSVTLDRETGELLSGPDFVSRGFLDPSDSNGLYEVARDRLETALTPEQAVQGPPDIAYVVGRVRDTLNSLVYERTRRRPMILPVVTEV